MNKDFNPLVSIIIPMYNAEKFIKETIESCLSQTHKNYEIIVVDDESSDNSCKIVETFSDKYDNIKLFIQKNSGAQKARNLGIEKSKGEYLQFLDADDILSKDKISSQVELAKKYGKNCLYSCKFERFIDSIDKSTYQKKLIDKSFDKPIEWLIVSWSNGGMGQTSIWLISRILVNKIGMWNEDLTKNQDGEYFCRAILNSKKIIFSHTSKVYYRITGNTSISYQMNRKASLATLYSYDLYSKHIKKFKNLELNKALAFNYISFINHFYPNFNDLLEEAEEKINILGFKLNDFNLPGNLGKLSNIIGFKNALRVRNIIRKRIK